MASGSTALKHWSRLIQKWPVDKVRPDRVSFQKLMQARLDRYANPTQANQAKASQSNTMNVQPPNLAWDEAKEMRQVNALYSLLENRYVKESPMSQAMRKPASMPDHYNQIVLESERAPERSFFTRFSQKLRGMIRLT